MPQINKDYIASKIFRNKGSLESKHDIANNIEQYVGVNENVLLDTHATLQQAIKNNLYEIKQNGKTKTIGMAREEAKAKRDSTSKSLFWLPVIGMILYVILYGCRQIQFSKVKAEETRQLQQALINALETNPMFLKTAEQYVANIIDKNEKKIYEQCLSIAQQHLGEVSDGKYDKAVEETIEYLKMKNNVVLDKELLNEMYTNNTPEHIQKKIKDLQDNKQLSLSFDTKVDNSQLLKKMKEASLLQI